MALAEIAAASKLTENSVTLLTQYC